MTVVEEERDIATLQQAALLHDMSPQHDRILARYQETRPGPVERRRTLGGQESPRCSVPAARDHVEAWDKIEGQRRLPL
jgi:hypothetical protein